MTEKPKQIRVRHERENKRVPIGLALSRRHAESHGQVSGPAAAACASTQMLPGADAGSRSMSATINPAVCAAIIRSGSFPE